MFGPTELWNGGQRLCLRFFSISLSPMSTYNIGGTIPASAFQRSNLKEVAFIGTHTVFDLHYRKTLWFTTTYGGLKPKIVVFTVNWWTQTVLNTLSSDHTILKSRDPWRGCRTRPSIKWQWKWKTSEKLGMGRKCSSLFMLAWRIFVWFFCLFEPQAARRWSWSL